MRGRGHQRRTMSWALPAGLVAVGVVEGVLFVAQGRSLPAVLTIAALGLLAWLASPAAFPRPLSRAAATAPTPATDTGVIVYWRPGCPYCLRLRLSLGRLARRARWVDIWADEDAAAFVRAANGGNETVPTVVVRGTVHTNPEVSAVREALNAR